MKKILSLTFIFLTIALTGCKDSPLQNSQYTATGDSSPIIISPEENEWFARNQAVTYCWELPDGVSPEEVAGHEVQFSNTPTPNGPWDAVRFFTESCWHYAAGHQGIYETLYWRMRVVYKNGNRSPWAVTFHRVGPG